jgi:hypothetical protein
MKRKLLLAVHTLLAVTTTTSLFAAPTPTQQIDVVNMLWNTNATSGAAELTQTSVIVAFNNGGAKPCATSVVAFQGVTTVLAGAGQACVAPITSISLTPVTGPAGLIYSAPADTTISGTLYATQIIVDGKTDPVFNATNGSVTTPGTVQVTQQNKLKQD